MICPNCGRTDVAGKNYCPACGLRLEAIAQLLAQEQGQLSGHDKAGEFFHTRRGPSVFVLGFLAVFLGLLLAFIGGAIIQDTMVANVGILTMILGMAGVGFSAITRIERGWRHSSPAKTKLPEATTNPLPQTALPASITEQTTRNLVLSLEEGEARRPSRDLSLS